MRRVAGIEISQCPHCAAGRWVVTLTRLRDRQALAFLLRHWLGGRHEHPATTWYHLATSQMSAGSLLRV